MRISDWSSDVCSSDLHVHVAVPGKSVAGFADWTNDSGFCPLALGFDGADIMPCIVKAGPEEVVHGRVNDDEWLRRALLHPDDLRQQGACIADDQPRSEEHTFELKSLMRISYAVFCLKKKNNITIRHRQSRCKINIKQ